MVLTLNEGEATTVEALSLLKTRAQSFLQNKRGAVAFEYVLIIGGVSVVLIGLLTGAGAVFMPAVIDAVCAAANTLGGITITAGSCTP